MVNHNQQISFIIEILTSYNGAYYPNKGKLSAVEESLPKYIVLPLPNKHNNSNVHEGEFFKIECEADTLENLETMIKDILGLATDAAAGFSLGLDTTRTETFTIKDYTDDISRDLTSSETEIMAGVTGMVYDQTPPGGIDDWYYLVKFVNQLGIPIPQGTQLTTAVIRVTSAQSYGNEVHRAFIINGFKGGSIPSPTDTLFGVWDNNDTTKQYKNGDHGAYFLVDTEHTLDGSDSDSIIDVIQEIIDDAGFDGDFGLSFLHDVSEAAVPFKWYSKDVSNTNPTKYMELDLVWPQDWDGFPFWITCELIDKKYDDNHFRATIEIEAHWGL